MECPYCRTENAENASKCAACSSWIVEQPPVREWTRAQEGRRVAGVCRGLADWFGIPVAALRLLFIGSVFFGGWGILAYLAMWIAMPVRPARVLDAPTRVPPLKPEEPKVDDEPATPTVAPLAGPVPVEVMPSP
ncbi:MAG: PspC domain-containing protein [Myxococcales bacterium]